MRPTTYSLGFENVRCDHLAEDALSADVPQLHRHVQIARQFDSPHKEVQADRLLVRSGELILAEAAD